MLTNRELKVQVVKKPRRHRRDQAVVNENIETYDSISPEEVAEISTAVKDVVTYAAVVVGAVYTGTKLLNTLCTIAINAAPKN